MRKARVEHPIGSLEYYLNRGKGPWGAEVPWEPHEVVAWRKMRNGRWIAWTYFGFYSWNNIVKWVTTRGDIYQIATANGAKNHDQTALFRREIIEASPP